MYRNIKKTILITALAYGLIYVFISEQSANFLLALFVIFYVAVYFIKSLFADFFYKFSYRLAPKEFVKDKTTLVNENCIVKYSPDEKLTVEDNYTPEQRREKRFFTLYKRNGAPVNLCWNEICNVFNAYTYFDSLSALIAKTTPVKIKLVSTTIKKSDSKPAEKPKPVKKENEQEVIVQKDIHNAEHLNNKNEKIKEGKKEKQTSDNEFINMDEIKPDTYGINNVDSPGEKDYFVDFDKIKKINPEK